jgi:hypothetical protein
MKLKLSQNTAVLVAAAVLGVLGALVLRALVKQVRAYKEGWPRLRRRPVRTRSLAAPIKTPIRAPPKRLQPVTGWKSAMATYYNSYPLCCSDPTADQKECDQNNGCAYQGMFKAFGDERKSRTWVQDNNIAAVFQVPDHKNIKEWDTKWKGRKLEIKNEYGVQMIVNVLDTCKDSDCMDSKGKGCCTTNAKAGGGTLVDLEFNTANRFWGAGAIPGMKTIQWRLVE